MTRSAQEKGLNIGGLFSSFFFLFFSFIVLPRLSLHSSSSKCSSCSVVVICWSVGNGFKGVALWEYIKCLWLFLAMDFDFGFRGRSWGAGFMRLRVSGVTRHCLTRGSVE